MTRARFFREFHSTLSNQASTFFDTCSEGAFEFLNLQRLATSTGAATLERAVLVHSFSTGHAMLKISIVDTGSERRLVVEGKLIPPWVSELRKSWRVAAADLDGRKLVVDLTNATVISPEGKDALFEIMQAGGKFCCCGVLTKHMLKELAFRYQNRIRNSDHGHD